MFYTIEKTGLLRQTPYEQFTAFMYIRVKVNLGKKKFWSCQPLKSLQMTLKKLGALNKIFILTLTHAAKSFSF